MSYVPGQFIVTAAVEHEMRFEAYGRSVAFSLNAALVEAATLTLNEVRRQAPYGRRRDSGDLPGLHVPEGVHLRDSFRFEIFRLPSLGMINWKGLAGITVWSPNPNAIWQELGTRGRRRKALREPNREGNAHRTAGSRGVRATHFMRDGLEIAYPAAVRLIQAALEGAGTHLGGGVTLIDAGHATRPASSRSIGSGP